IIQPKIVGDSMGLPPLLSLLFLYLGFKLSGISGMILAVPAGMIVLNLYKYGAFDSLIENLQLLMEEIRNIRKKE
ncbi:MAG: AI-2E family transporter, partial [Hungatella sp.]